MKKFITCLVAVFFAGTVACFADDKATVQANEKAAWQAYKDKKADDFKKIVDKDLRCVYGEAIADMASELADMPKWNIKSFSISDFNSFSDEKDVIVTTYVVKLDATMGTQDMSGTYNAGTVWKKEGSNWLAIFHTHNKQAAAAGGSKSDKDTGDAHKNE